MARTPDQSTWLRFCKKYRAEVVNGGGKSFFQTVKLPDKTRYMAKAYLKFKTQKGLGEPPAKKKSEDNAHSKYVDELRKAIDSSTFQFNQEGNADQVGFLTVV